VWGRCFPEAQRFDDGRIPSRDQVIDTVSAEGFFFMEVKAIHQFFASSYAEYYEKISHRGLSSLISISDEAFSAGLARLKTWTSNQPQNQPVSEPVDLFIFQKQ